MLTNLETHLIAPYGGKLVNLLSCDEQRHALLERAIRLPAVAISPRAQYDLELMAVGAFSPLDRFMGKKDYQRVMTEMRLQDGTLFPIPVTLNIDSHQIPFGVEALTLMSESNLPLAIIEIEEVYSFDVTREARLVLGITDPCHPLVAEMRLWGDVCVSGRVEVLNLPHHRGFGELCLTPFQTRSRIEAMGCPHVVAFQTRNPMHRIHEELTKRAAAEVDGSLLIHPVVGLTKPGDVDEWTRIQIYEVLVKNYYDPSRTLLSLLPLAMRLAGPREAIWHALIRRNYGATHFIIGRDHAGPGKNSSGEPFYGLYEAQMMLAQYADEIGVQPLEFKELVYLADEDRYEETGKAPPGARVFSISGTQVRQDYLAKGKRLPTWFTRPEVAEILHRRSGQPLQPEPSPS